MAGIKGGEATKDRKMDKEFKKIDFKDYKVEITKGKDLKKAQRLALEIIEWCGKSAYDKRWFMVCKKYTEFVEDRFRVLKEKEIKNGGYLWRMIFPKKPKKII